MAVDGVDQRNRNDYARKDAETERKHADEINRLRQEHYEKLKQLQDVYQQAMDQQREETKEAITERDLKYQQEMEELRRMNRERTMALTSTYEDRLQKTKETSQNTIENERKVSDLQKKNLSETFTNELRKKDKTYQEALDETKKMQQQGVQKEREGLSQRHTQEVRALTKERNQTVEHLSDNLRNLRQAKDNAEKEHKIQSFKQKLDTQDMYAHEIMRERKTNNEQMRLQKEGYDMALDKIQDRHQEALKKEQERNQENLSKLGDNVSNRNTGQLAILERRLRESKDKSNDRILEYKRLSDIERQHMYEAVGKNLEASERTRLAAVEDSNVRNREEIRKMAQKNVDVLHTLDRSNKERMNMLKVQHEEEIGQKTSVLKDQNDKLKIEAEQKNRQRVETANREKKQLEEFYYHNLSEMKRTYDEALVEQRSNAAKERSQAMEKIQLQMRNNEARAQEKFGLMSANYEKKIADIQANHKKDIAVVRRDYETRIKNDQKLSQQNLDNLKLKYESQLASQKEAYEEKLRQMQSNHEEEKINMAKSTT